MRRSIVISGVVLALAAALLASRAVAAPAPGDGADPPIAVADTHTASWVFFRDHGSAASLDSAVAVSQGILSPRAIARREKAARERGDTRPTVDNRDLEPDGGYVAAVAATGARIRTRSRWANAVSVDADGAVLAAIRALPFVADIRTVARLEACATVTPEAEAEFSYGPAEHQLEMLGVPEAHAMGYRGEGVLVCVLDSGFELGHEAFDHLEVRATRDFIFHDDDVAFDPRQDFPTQSNHGTQVLSILAGYAPGRLIGPAYRADYILGKTERIGSETRSEEDAWCEAIEWAEAMGADIVTSSLSYTQWYTAQDRDGVTALISRAANLAFERGVLIFNSIGNQGPHERTLGPPSDAAGTIAVGAVDWNGRLTGFSSLGPTWDGRVKPDLVAMGSGVAHAVAGTRSQYGHGGGTSYSTPLVAGCAAIVLSAHPDWGPEAVRDALVMSGNHAGSPDNRYGWGVPNVRDALLYPLLEGRVTDKATHEPLAGARISWEGVIDSAHVSPGDSPARGSTVTDSTGAYVIPNLARGSYRIRGEAAGYLDAETEPLDMPPSLGDVNLALEYRGK